MVRMTVTASERRRKEINESNRRKRLRNKVRLGLPFNTLYDKSERDVNSSRCRRQPALRMNETTTVAKQAQLDAGHATVVEQLVGPARLRAAATVALMTAFGATLALAVGAISIRALRARNWGIGAVLGRPTQALGLLFKFGHSRLQLQQDDFDQFRLGELLQLLAHHGGNCWSKVGCESTF